MFIYLSITCIFSANVNNNRYFSPNRIDDRPDAHYVALKMITSFVCSRKKHCFQLVDLSTHMFTMNNVLKFIHFMGIIVDSDDDESSSLYKLLTM